MRRCLLLLLCPLLALAQPAKIETHTLPNGLKILIEEDHDIPNVALYLFFKVGSRDERPGLTGISHFFEHMMFNGAKKFGPKQFDIQMEQNGGRNNAYTSNDLTVYTDWFPSNALPLMFDMEADRMQHLSFDPKMIESERGVVASERQTSVENSNSGLLYEQLAAAAYTAHPYGWPVVGWASDIQAWTMDDLKEHFRMGYAPNNCVMVVVGDVSAAQVLKLANEHLAKIPRQNPPPAVRTVEPPQQGERRVSVLKPAQLPIQMFSFHVPNASHKDTLPLQVLGSVLTSGRSSRLYRKLVDGEIALRISQSVEERLDPSQMIFFLSPRAGVDPAKAEQALFEEIERVRSAEVPAEEIQKAKNQMLTSLYREMKTIAGRANLLGQFEIFFNDHRKLFDYEKDLAAITSKDLLRVATQYLTPKNRTVATLIPDPAAKPSTNKEAAE